MKKIMGIVMVALFIFSSNAAATELKLQADDAGKVILDSKKSPDGNEYILYNAEPEQEFNVMTTSATTFSTNDYRNGFFDSPTTTYTTSWSFTNREDWRRAINNNPDNLALMLQGSMTFADELTLEAVYVHAQNTTVKFFNASNVMTKSFNVDNRTLQVGTYYDMGSTKVKRIEFAPTNNRYNHYFAEFEIFPIYNIDYIAVANLDVNAETDRANVTFTNPNSRFWRYNQVLLDEKVIAANTTNQNIQLNDLEQDTYYQVTVRSYYSDGKYIDAIKSFKTQKDTTPPAKVTNLKAVQDGNNIKLTYDLPPDADFSHVQILRAYAFLTKEHKDTTYIDTSPLANKLNSYTVRAVDKNGNVSAGVSVSIMHDTGEVKSLKAVAEDFTNVQLQWQNTSLNGFEVVKIYRKSADAPMMQRMMNLFSANDGFTPLFETNGTSFKDLTVAAESEYTYKVTSVVAGNESAGVTTTIITPKVSVIGSEIEPPPGQTVDPTAPYVITWQQPTTGKILVKVGGVDYKTVNASDKSITIPKKEMKYDFLGAPNVQLVPIDDNGNPGMVTKPGTPGGGELGTVKMPDDLTASNLLLSGVALLGVVGAFVLLGLAFRVVPKLINMIRTSYEARGRKA